MARISVVALLCYFLQSSPFTLASTLIDSNGVLTRVSISESSVGNKGIVSIVSSPGTKSFFGANFDDNAAGVTLIEQDGVSILTSSGATLTGTTSLSKGHGAAAASAVAGSVILTGITESDLEYGLLDSRHGQTLTNIFRAKIASINTDDEVKATKLFIALPPCDVDEELVKIDAQKIFETSLVEKNIGSVDFETVFDINIVKVESEDDAKKVCLIHMLK
jgi:hypothetical protein